MDPIIRDAVRVTIGRMAEACGSSRGRVALLALAMPFIILCGIVMLPRALACAFSDWRHRRRFREELCRAGRLLDWQAIRERVLAGRGTLIVVVPILDGPADAWLVEPDLSRAHPDCPLPPFEPSATLCRPEDQPAIQRWFEAHLPALAANACLATDKWCTRIAELPRPAVRMVEARWAARAWHRCPWHHCMSSAAKRGGPSAAPGECV